MTESAKIVHNDLAMQLAIALAQEPLEIWEKTPKHVRVHSSVGGKHGNPKYEIRKRIVNG